MIAINPNAGPLEPANTEKPRQKAVKITDAQQDATNADYTELGSFSDAKAELAMLCQEYFELTFDAATRQSDAKTAATRLLEIEKELRNLTFAVYRDYPEHTETYNQRWQQLINAISQASVIQNEIEAQRSRLVDVIKKVDAKSGAMRISLPKAVQHLTEIMTSASIGAIGGVARGTARGVRNVFKR